MLKLEQIKGVGKATLEKMLKLDIHSVFELFSFLPSKYVDLQQPISIFDMEEGQICLAEGKVTSVSDISPRGKRRFTVLFCDTNSSERAYFTAEFFNQPYLYSSFEIGKKYRLLAKPRNFNGKWILTNPLQESADKIDKLQGIFTVYPLKGILGQNTFKNILYNALDMLVPHTYEGSLAQVNRDFAICFENIHRPDNIITAESALENLAAIDLALALSMYRLSRDNARKNRKVLYNNAKSRIVDYKNALSFALTPSQEGAIEDICNQLCSVNCMSQIVNGDVGSGKTAVGFFAMYLAAAQGMQSALMAPTEILAAQHANAFAPIAQKLGINYALLTSSVSSADKRACIKGLAEGSIDCVIGTQALVADSVVYNNLALAVIDEQHRFGVNERRKLENKGASDILSMTATPIPRSMALAFYDDITISHIYKRDDAATNITTSIESDLNNAVCKLIKSCNEGKQAFIICPAIVDNEGYDTYSIEKFVREYRKEFSHLNGSILHGKMSDDDKNAAMREFAEGKTQLLIATTVVEVGIDTLASEILILNADRFGLASLHQLRGRVGRDGSPAHCYLHCASNNDKALTRLQTLCKYNDGQYLAEVDFAIRGAGDFMGTKQSGISLTPLFKLKMNAAVLDMAKKYADSKLSELSMKDLTALTRCSRNRVEKFLDDIRQVTLNS